MRSLLFGRVGALVLGLVITGPLAVAVSATPAAAESEPIYSRADAIVEKVAVDTGRDTDGDGKNDRLVADIMRPKVPAGVQVPTIVVASPYYTNNSPDTWDSNGLRRKWPDWLDEFFVPRGYAIAQVDITGTNRSEGCFDVGGPNEILGVKAFFDWLGGRTTAVDGANRPVVADWHSGKAGMTGFSWGASTANGVAATGVEGLTTIVPVAGISNWYSYMRGYGLNPSPSSMMRVRAKMYSQDPYGRAPDRSGCETAFARIRAEAGDKTGNYDPNFWDSRNYSLRASNVKASVFLVHGLMDQNVKTDQFGQWWKQLSLNNVSRKMLLYQGAHISPERNNFDQYVPRLQAWFDYWLKGIQNRIMEEPAVTVQREDASYGTSPTWPVGKYSTGIRLRSDADALGLNLGSGARTSTETVSITSTEKLQKEHEVVNPVTPGSHRAAFLTRRFAADTRLNGAPQLWLKFRSSQPQAGVTVRLVSYGRAERAIDVTAKEGVRRPLPPEPETKRCVSSDYCISTAPNPKQTNPYVVYSKLEADLGHYSGLGQRQKLDQAQWYTIVLPLPDDDYVIKKGQQLGVIISLRKGNGYDETADTTVEISARESTFVVPSVTPIEVTAESFGFSDFAPIPPRAA